MMDEPMPLPLVITGPGGAYATRYVPRGSRLVAEPAGLGGHSADDGPADAYERHRGHDHSPARPVTLLDRLLGIDRLEVAPPPPRPATNRVTLWSATLIPPGSKP